MPALFRWCPVGTKDIIESAIEYLAHTGLYACIAACFTLTMPVFAQSSSGAAITSSGVQPASETQAKLNKLNADLTTAEAKNDLAGAAKILNAIGALYYFDVSDYPRAIDKYQQAFANAKAALDLQQQASALNGIANCYRLQNKLEQSIQRFEQALEVASQSSDKHGQSAALIGLGTVSSRKGQNQKALGYYSQALPLVRQTGDRAQEATILRRIGFVYYHMGEGQKALENYNQALPILRELGNRADESALLKNIADVYHNLLSENQKALEYHVQALAIERATGDRVGEATTLMSIGVVYQVLGENQKALDYFNQALPILRETDSRGSEAATLSDIGDTYRALGENQKALDFYNRALLIWRKTGDRGGEAATMTAVANVYAYLGENQKALDSFNQILPIIRDAGDRAGEAEMLNDIGNVYSLMGENQKALENYNQALSISRQEDDRSGEARALNSIGSAYSRLAENQKAALSYYDQALPIYRQAGEREGEAATLTNIGHVYADLGEKQKALDNLGQALPIAVFVNEPQLQIDVLEDLFDIEKNDRPSLAILYGKQAINLLQQLRGNINGLQEEVQEAFLASIANEYHDLAGLLIKEGRLSEAQQVLNLLKRQEYKDYSRGETSEALNSLSLTPAELSAEEDYQRSTATVVEQGRRWSELKQSKSKTPEQEKEFQQLSDALGKASELMNSYFTRLYKQFSQGRDANRQVANISDETASLKQQISKMPHTVALYTVVSKDRYSVIVITGSTMVAREYVIPDKDLHQQVAAFRQVILDPSQDPKPLAQALYKILISPIKADLDQAKAQTLIWSLDGVLRYVPFAALFDGQHYLVENYNLASFTPVSIPRISDKPDLAAVSAVGMGISAKLDERLNPLPKVETELESIVQDPQMKGAEGVMPGTILLNAKFTVPAMEKQLDGEHSVVHIASHFVMRPGDDSQSYLLMAGNEGAEASYHMTVADFRDDQKMSLEGTELLTLSACDTGIGGSSANGREVDGLATTAQRKGAKAVISSLWQLNDDSTAYLMADFYRRWIEGGGKVMKAGALRQAQLDLLTGKVVPKPESSQPRTGANYSKPYYWAPFVLMGNWQ